MTFDFSADHISFDLLNILLLDRTTNRNIIWATHDHKNLDAHSEMKNDSELEKIQPRFLKSAEHQKNRSRYKAEIFTPAWLCNEQNNLIDESFFHRSNVFNVVDSQNHTWQPTSEKIPFDEKITWQDYVTSNRLEITCGEAPYLVSRYDAVSGKIIDLENRIGILDRKIRVVNENTSTKLDWLNWITKAFQSVYGYEFQGDNLLLARKNLLMTFVEYYQARFDSTPEQKILEEIAEVISWNLWQMDGLTNAIPYHEPHEKNPNSISLFEPENVYCKIRDWFTGEILEYRRILKEVKR